MYEPTPKTCAQIIPVARRDFAGCCMATDLRIEYYALGGDQLLHAGLDASKGSNNQRSTWWAGRESNPDLQLRTLPCCSVTLPTHLELAPGIQPGSLR